QRDESPRERVQLGAAALERAPADEHARAGLLGRVARADAGHARQPERAPRQHARSDGDGEDDQESSFTHGPCASSCLRMILDARKTVSLGAALALLSAGSLALAAPLVPLPPQSPDVAWPTV